MSRFEALVGYESPGEMVNHVYQAVVVERDYTGEELQVLRSLIDSGKVNSDISLLNRYSIWADAYALEHYSWIKYLVKDEVRWTVTSVEVQRPRLILSLGGVYNGPSPTP